MQCETCGKHFIEGKRVKIEGCIATVCNDCARYGQVVGDVRPYVEPPKPKLPAKPAPIAAPSLSKVLATELAVPTLKEDYGKIIKNAREKRSLKMEDFAKMLNEKLSAMQSIESGHLKPDIKVAQKIKKTFGLNLIKEIKKEFVKLDKAKSDVFTLGDFIKKKN